MYESDLATLQFPSQQIGIVKWIKLIMQEYTHRWSTKVISKCKGYLRIQCFCSRWARHKGTYHNALNKCQPQILICFLIFGDMRCCRPIIRVPIYWVCAYLVVDTALPSLNLIRYSRVLSTKTSFHYYEKSPLRWVILETCGLNNCFTGQSIMC